MKRWIRRWWYGQSYEFRNGVRVCLDVALGIAAGIGIAALAAKGF